jgi:hypothetical protein
MRTTHESERTKQDPKNKTRPEGQKMRHVRAWKEDDKSKSVRRTFTDKRMTVDGGHNGGSTRVGGPVEWGRRGQQREYYTQRNEHAQGGTSTALTRA